MLLEQFEINIRCLLELSPVVHFNNNLFHGLEQYLKSSKSSKVLSYVHYSCVPKSVWFVCFEANIVKI